MKSKLIIAALLALPAATACAQRLSIAETTVDAGRSGYRIPVTATFELRNKSMRKLLIQDVKPDCSCTKVEFPKEEIGAGDRFTIKMTYDGRMLGHYNKQAAIISNGSKKPVYITMTGVVLADLMDYSGSYPYDFGGLLLDANNLEFDDVNKGDHPVQEIHVMNNGTKPMTPNVLHLPPYLTAQAEPEQLSPGHSGKIVFTLNSEKIRDYGLTQTGVYVARQLGEKVNSEIEVPVSAVLLPDLDGMVLDNAPSMQLSATELNFDFGSRKKQGGTIGIANMGRQRLDISALQMFTRGLKVTLGKRSLAPGETTKLKITAYADELGKAKSRPRVLMITNDPNNAKVVINVKVSGER